MGRCLAAGSTYGFLAVVLAGCFFDGKGLSPAAGDGPGRGDAVSPGSEARRDTSAADQGQPLEGPFDAATSGEQPLVDSVRDSSQPIDGPASDNMTVDLSLPCGPSTCAGCCQAGQCRTGQEATACGAAGGACASCGLKVCDVAGKCSPCASSAECAGATVCSKGDCLAAYGLKYDLTILDASVAATDASGKPWDSMSPGPYPYVKVRVDGQTDGVSTIKKDTLFPVWNYVITTTVSPTTALRF